MSEFNHALNVVARARGMTAVAEQSDLTGIFAASLGVQPEGWGEQAATACRATLASSGQ